MNFKLKQLLTTGVNLNR